MKYFIDTNIIIDFLNKDEQAIKTIEEIAQDEESEIFINRLVCIESLRTIHFDNRNIFRKAKETIEVFEKVEIKHEVYDRAIDFSRYCKSKGVQLKGRCEAIDFLHFITAKYYGLTIVTNDKDFDKLELAYMGFINE